MRLPDARLWRRAVPARGLVCPISRRIQDLPQEAGWPGRGIFYRTVKIALAAEDPAALRDRVEEVRKRLKPFMGLRIEVGGDQVRAARYFSTEPTARLDRTREVLLVWTLDAGALGGTLTGPVAPAPVEATR